LKKLQESEIEVTGYPLKSYPASSMDRLPEDKLEPKMVVTCKSCGKEFDSTFTFEDFAALSKEQFEAGTLHLCPFCGNLSLYEMKDYHEPQAP
jgi:hypothetical protein